MIRRAAFVLLGVWTASCGSTANSIPGTKIENTEENTAIIRQVELYRLAVESKNAGKLLMMASKDYWDDRGTPSGADDYGYNGLQEVLARRFQAATGIRYSMRYMKIRRHRDLAFVEVVMDASFTIKNGRGEDERRDVHEPNQLVLRAEGNDWKFLSGM